jgi:hypothetical protein
MVLDRAAICRNLSDWTRRHHMPLVGLIALGGPVSVRHNALHADVDLERDRSGGARVLGA